MRLRRLEFDTNSEQDRTRVSMLYHGFLTGGNQPQPKTIEVIRRESAMLDKFEDVITVTETFEPSTGNREVKIFFKPTPDDRPTTVSIVLNQPEFELLKKYFEQTPWTVRVSREVIDISDWLASLPVTEG